jgi:putative inorganic carbon (HCO3(-)) transporter
VGASVVSTRLLLPTLVVAGVFWGIRWVAGAAFGTHPLADAAIVLLSSMALISLTITTQHETTLTQVYRLFSGIALTYAIVRSVSFSPPARMLLLATALVVVTFFLSLATPFTTWIKYGRILDSLPVNVRGVFPTLTSDVSNPNVLAGQIVILLPFSVAMVMSGWRSLGVLRWLFATLTASIALAMLIFTQSTGALVALAAMLVVGIVLFLVKKRWHMFVVILLGMIGIFILIDQATFLLELPPVQKTIESRSSQGRIELWQHALYLIRDFPFTGIGMGTYKEVAHTLYPFQVMPPSRAFHAHNILLQVGVDLGIPGLIAWVCLFLLVMWQGWRIYRDGQRQPSLWLRNLGIAILCSQVALLTHGMVDAVTWGMVRPAPLVWAIWGLALAYTTTAHDGGK